MSTCLFGRNSVEGPKFGPKMGTSVGGGGRRGRGGDWSILPDGVLGMSNCQSHLKREW